MDCPDSCALEVTVADGRIERLWGARDHPDTAGFICTKVSRFARRVYHDDRLLHPLRRTGVKGTGEFEPISWDEAIGEITERFLQIRREWGGEAILPYHYGGSNGYLSDGFLDDLYFARLGASRLARTLCAVPTTMVAADMYGKMPGVAFEDYPNAKCIVIWGANPKASNIHLVPYLRQAKRAGAFVIVVDPVRNFTAREADLHLPVFPGADLPVALAMIKLWRDRDLLDRNFLSQHAVGVDVILQSADEWSVERAAEEARVPADAIRRLAEAYAAGSPAVIRCGWGVERNRNGGQAVAAILAMPALLGKFGVKGGGYTMSNNGAAKLDRSTLFGELGWEWDTRVINMTQLGAVLSDTLDPAIKGLFVYNCNPAVTVPDQNAVLEGLARDDLFTVVFDQVMTDTAAYADIVLPATTFLEHWDVRVSYGSYVAGGVRPAIAPRGEAKSNPEVFAALGRAMGWSDEPFQWDVETCFQRAVQALSMNGSRVDAALLAEGKVQQYAFPDRAPVQFGTVYPQTSDGKIQLAPSCLGPRPYAYRGIASDRYSLALVSPATGKMITSTLGEFNFPELYVEVHPRDAQARGITDGDRVRVFNDLGEVVCRARVRDKIRSGVVSMPKGAWRKASLNGKTATALCPAEISVVGGSACYNDARVEIEKSQDGESR